MSVNWTLWDESPLFSFFFYSHAISWTKWVKKKKESVQLCFITHTMTPRLGKLEVARKGIDDQGRGGKGATNTSVLSLSAAKTPHRKHGHVQICLRLERPPAEMFPDLGFLIRGLVGILCCLMVIAMFVRVTLTSRAVAQTSRWHKHVNHCRQLLTPPASLCVCITYRCPEFYSEWRALFPCFFSFMRPLFKSKGKSSLICQHNSFVWAFSFLFLCVANVKYGFQTLSMQCCLHMSHANRPGDTESEIHRGEGEKRGAMFGWCCPIILLHWNLSGKKKIKNKYILKMPVYRVLYQPRQDSPRKHPAVIRAYWKAFLSPLEELTHRKWLNIKPHCCTLIQRQIPDVFRCLSCFLPLCIHLKRQTNSHWILCLRSSGKTFLKENYNLLNKKGILLGVFFGFVY